MLRALTDRSRTGGSPLATFSLARTARWLTHDLASPERERTAGPQSPGGAYDPAAHLRETDSPTDRLRYALPPVSFTGAPAHRRTGHLGDPARTVRDGRAGVAGRVLTAGPALDSRTGPGAPPGRLACRCHPSYDLPMTSNDRYLARGPRVGIRHFTAADRAEFTALARESAELHRPWLFPPTTDAAYDGYLLRLQEPQREGFLICERDDGRIAGYLTINNIVHGAFRCGAIGYGAFAHAAGRGLMSEGLRLVIQHAFTELGLHRLEVNIQPANELSIALVKRAGFRLEGFSPDFLFIDGAWRDHERWAITAEMVSGRAGRADVGAV